MSSFIVPERESKMADIISQHLTAKLQYQVTRVDVIRIGMQLLARQEGLRGFGVGLEHHNIDYIQLLREFTSK